LLRDIFESGGHATVGSPRMDMVCVIAIGISGAALAKSRIPVDAKALWKSYGVYVVERIAYLKARILERHPGPMRRARQAPHERVRARFEHPRNFRHDRCEPSDPRIAATLVVIPILAHEGDPRWRIGHAGINGVVRQRAQCDERIGVLDVPIRLAAEHTGDCRMKPEPGLREEIHRLSRGKRSASVL